MAAIKSEKWDSMLQLQQHMRKEEAPLPFQLLSEEQIELLSKFIATHRDEITLPTHGKYGFIISTEEQQQQQQQQHGGFLDLWNYIERYSWDYNVLCSLLHLLQEKSVLQIIDDTYSDEVLYRIRKLRIHDFGGCWFDSLEKIIIDNEQNNKLDLMELEGRERPLKFRYHYACERLEYLIAITDLTGEEAKMKDDMINNYGQQRKESESELATVMEKKNVICHARESLNFFYPTI